MFVFKIVSSVYRFNNFFFFWSIQLNPQLSLNYEYDFFIWCIWPKVWFENDRMSSKRTFFRFTFQKIYFWCNDIFILVHSFIFVMKFEFHAVFKVIFRVEKLLFRKLMQCPDSSCIDDILKKLSSNWSTKVSRILVICVTWSEKIGCAAANPRLLSWKPLYYSTIGLLMWIIYLTT